jgi:hypothetical protein
LIHEAFSRGELSYAKVRALTRVAEAKSEEELLELARHMTASQLERAVRAYRRVTAEDAEDLHALAYAGYTWEPDGSLVIRARLAPEDGALFVRALEASRDRLQEGEWSEERAVPRNRGDRRAQKHSSRLRRSRSQVIRPADRAVSGIRSLCMLTPTRARPFSRKARRSP